MEDITKYRTILEECERKLALPEGETLLEKVVIKLDPDNPMDNSMIATLGGAGSWSFKGIRDKARREADELARRLNASDHPQSFRDSAYNIKQLANTLNTIVAAYDELNEIRQRGGTRSRGITASEE